MNAKTIIKNHQKFNNLPFHIERFCPTEPIQLHYHDCVELILCTGGEALYHIEDTCFQPGEGSLYIIGEYPAHSLSDFNNFESYRILFDMSMLECLDDEIKTSSGFTSMFLLSSSGYSYPGYKCCVGMSGNYYSQAVSLMEMLLTAYETEDALNEKYITSLFHSLCILIVQCHHANQVSPSKSFSDKVIGEILSNLNEKITADDIAKKLGISGRYFRMLFTKEHGGISPAQFIIDLRLRKAKSLLSCSDKSITEIAFSCGFYDSSHLTKFFKKYEGMTPKEYRKRTRQS